MNGVPSEFRTTRRVKKTFSISENEAFNELLHQMAKRLDFPFDKVAIQRNAYSPLYQGKLEDDQELIRKGVVDLLTGKRALSTISWVMPGQLDSSCPSTTSSGSAADSRRSTATPGRNWKKRNPHYHRSRVRHRLVSKTSAERNEGRARSHRDTGAGTRASE